jgi:hypothetical protein
VKRYSEFINFPIYIWGSKEVDVEVPADEDDESSEEEDTSMYNLRIQLDLHFSRFCVLFYIKIDISVEI